MPLAFWCVLAAGVMPIVLVGFAKVDGTFDNANPRQWLARREGFQARAHAAHLNSFEAFPLFAAGVFAATWQGAAQTSVDLWAIAFLACRVAYAWAYLADKPNVRTVFWLAALASSVALFVLAALGPA